MVLAEDVVVMDTSTLIGAKKLKWFNCYINPTAGATLDSALHHNPLLIA